MYDGEIKARVTSNRWNDPLSDELRLTIYEKRGAHAISYLASDGTWRTLPEGSAATDVGIALPEGSLPAIAQAIEEYMGKASHARTEVAVLREWLKVERERVDKALGQ